jgi:hypothetical protein
VRFNICRAVLDHYLKARIDVALPMAIEDHRHAHPEQLAGRTRAHHFDVNMVRSNGKLQRRAYLVHPREHRALDPEIFVAQLGSLRDRLVGRQVVIDGVGKATLDEETERTDDDDSRHDPLAPSPEGLPPTRVEGDLCLGNAGAALALRDRAGTVSRPRRSGQRHLAPSFGARERLRDRSRRNVRAEYATNIAPQDSQAATT